MIVIFPTFVSLTLERMNIKNFFSFIILMIVITITNPTSSYCQADNAEYITYKNVVELFFGKYSVAGIPNTSQVRFEKRPDGWHVCIIEYTDKQVTTKDELYWDKEKNKFNELHYNKAESEIENFEILNNYLNDWNAAYFAIYPYYGYPGWDWDVINELKDKKSHSDTSLYALARAYSSYAGNLLNFNSGFADSTKMFKLPEGKNSMTNEQLAEYRKYRHLGIEKFKALAIQNPLFETIVGKIGIKAANEYMTSFIDIMIYQNETEAKKELADGIYNDFMIAFAKNYLMACPENAILFTNGDNDTYPLIYVQTKLGYRPDVLVVNLSLLQTDRYINRLREPLLGAKGLPVTFTSEQIKGDKRDVIIVKNEKEEMDVSEMISFIKDDNNTTTYGEQNYFYSPSDNLFIINNNKRFEFSISNRYFLLNQLIFYDILVNNKWERPLCFAITVSEDYFFGMNDYFQLRGMIYLLDKEKKNNSGYGIGSVDTEFMYNLMMKYFDKSGIGKVVEIEKLPLVNYRNILYRLAEALIIENQKDKAVTILDKGVELIPDNILFFDVYMIPFVDYYFTLNEFEKGNKIAKKIVENIKNDKSNFNTGSISDDYKQQWLYMIKDIAEKYNQQELLKELE